MDKKNSELTVERKFTVNTPLGELVISAKHESALWRHRAIALKRR